MPDRIVVVDAGPLFAYVDADDDHHGPCRAFIENHPGPLVVPQLVIAEVTYMIGQRLGARAEILFLSDLVSGAFTTEPVAPGDWQRISELVARYRDFPLGTTDASVIACAERLGVTTVATTDRRHFGAVRPRHAETLDLVP
ncbi:type II toxin-antitoxin system VapC family toxin [Pseudonocardia sp. CA-107938]|uniref:type II toxin-antitoxin system VapC family toxin n=1 Tax=Pseudonocardia sp. CA-107938 TaxID=3240021 RepID=UPI003D8E5E4A